MGGIVSNTSFFIRAEAANRIIDWLLNTYIPTAEKVGFQPRHLLEPIDNIEPGTRVIVLHLYHNDSNAARRWLKDEGNELIGTVAGDDLEHCVWLHTFMTPLDHLLAEK